MKILELKSTITKIKNSSKRFNIRFELSDGPVHLKTDQQRIHTHSREQKESGMKEIEPQRNAGVLQVHQSMRTEELQEDGRKGKEQKKYLKKF